MDNVDLGSGDGVVLQRRESKERIAELKEAAPATVFLFFFNVL